MNRLSAFQGRFDGAGRWHDSTGQSQSYTIVQTNRTTSDGFEIGFKHAFEDGSVVDALFMMKRIAPFLFRSGTSIGHGYCFDDYWHYHLAVGGAFVEASYRVTPDGFVRIEQPQRRRQLHRLAGAPRPRWPDALGPKRCWRYIVPAGLRPLICWASW